MLICAVRSTVYDDHQAGVVAIEYHNKALM